MKKPPVVTNVRAYLYNPKLHKVVRIDDLKNLKPVAETHNLDMYAGYDVVGRAMAGYSNYYVNTFYFEFTNVGAGGVVPNPRPVFSGDDDITYYTGLAANYDYLRVPISIAPDLQASTADYTSNQVEFFATSSGNTSGENGEDFGSGALVLSTVYGLALVCAPDPSDKLQDIIVARAYFDLGDEVLLLPNQNIGITHSIKFEAAY